MDAAIPQRLRWSSFQGGDGSLCWLQQRGSILPLRSTRRERAIGCRAGECAQRLDSFAEMPWWHCQTRVRIGCRIAALVAPESHIYRRTLFLLTTSSILGYSTLKNGFRFQWDRR